MTNIIPHKVVNRLDIQGCATLCVPGSWTFSQEDNNNWQKDTPSVLILNTGTPQGEQQVVGAGQWLQDILQIY